MPREKLLSCETGSLSSSKLRMTASTSSAPSFPSALNSSSTVCCVVNAGSVLPLSSPCKGLAQNFVTRRTAPVFQRSALDIRSRGRVFPRDESRAGTVRRVLFALLTLRAKLAQNTRETRKLSFLALSGPVVLWAFGRLQVHFSCTCFHCLAVKSQAPS